MGLIFQRRVGAAADAKELEYIIALHQTCMPQTRENATVSSLDVYRLLRSRYRINAKYFTCEDAAVLVVLVDSPDIVESLADLDAEFRERMAKYAIDEFRYACADYF